MDRRGFFTALAAPGIGVGIFGASGTDPGGGGPGAQRNRTDAFVRRRPPSSKGALRRSGRAFAGPNAEKVQKLIDRAREQGRQHVVLPASLLPYDAAQVSFEPSVRLLREGQRTSVHDVAAYGADPRSGSVDDAASVQAAVDAASSSVVRERGRVHFPPGRFRVREPIRIANGVGVIVEGSGTLATIVEGPTRLPLFDVRERSVSFQHLTLDGRGVASRAIEAGNARASENRARLFLDDVRIQDFQVGVDVYNFHSCRLVGCWFMNNRDAGLLLRTVGYAVHASAIRDCLFGLNDRAVACGDEPDVAHIRNLSFQNNTIQSNRIGIELTGKPHAIEISHNWFENNDRDIAGKPTEIWDLQLLGNFFSPNHDSASGSVTLAPSAGGERIVVKWNRWQANKGSFDLAMSSEVDGFQVAHNRWEKGHDITATGIPTFEDGAERPCVEGSTVFRTDNSTVTRIENFIHAVPGSEITVIFGDENTIVGLSGDRMHGNGGRDWKPGLGDRMDCTFDGTDWYCLTSGSE